MEEAATKAAGTLQIEFLSYQGSQRAWDHTPGFERIGYNRLCTLLSGLGL
jgi:hypothetical protein